VWLLKKNDVYLKQIPTIIRVERIQRVRNNMILRSALQLLVTVNILPSLLIPFTLMTELIGYPKLRFLQESHGITSEDGTLHRHRRENLKSYIALTG
jgi:hypothetical protein